MPLRIYSRSAVSLETNTTTYLIGYCPSGVTCHATQPSSTAYRYRRNSHAHRPTRPRVNRFLECSLVAIHTAAGTTVSDSNGSTGDNSEAFTFLQIIDRSVESMEVKGNTTKSMVFLHPFAPLSSIAVPPFLAHSSRRATHPHPLSQGDMT
jgi:hypothetical protein